MPSNLSKDISLYSFINPPNVLILTIIDPNVNKIPEVNNELYKKNNERISNSSANVTCIIVIIVVTMVW